LQLRVLTSRLGAALGRWKSGVRHQVTWSGLAFTALILMIGLAAFASANNLLFLLLASMLSTMLVSGFVSHLSLAGIEVKLLLPEHVFARRTQPARIQLYNSKRWMPAFSVHLSSTSKEESPMQLYFPIVPGKTTLEAVTTACFHKRGLHGDSDYHFTTRFPFGFTERRLQVRLRREVLVYPSIDPQPQSEELLVALEGEMDAYLRGRGSDFYRVRPYEQSESVRHIDWKATAHTGEMQVREFAREEDHLIEIFLDLAVPAADTEWFEEAIECVAYLSWRLAAKGGRLRLVTQNCDLRLPESADVYTIFKYLAQASPLRSKKVLVQPHAESSFQILFSAAPEALADAGWHAARIVTPERTAAAATSTGPDAAAAAGSTRVRRGVPEDLGHGRR
jgi:uncharacterized protein (DUF58 family)